MHNIYTEDAISNVLPQKLKALRLRQGLTMEEVGEKLNKTRAAVSTWESGKAMPDVVTLFKLRDLYNIADFNDFVDVQPSLEFQGLSKKEQRLIRLFRSSSPTVQKSIEILLKECNKK